MSLRRYTYGTVVAALAGVLALTGLAAPAEAAIARTVSLKVTPTVQYVGTAVTFSGTLSKSPVGSTVRIQRKSGTSWVLARTTQTTSAAGAYSVKLNAPTTAGTYTYRALAPATATRAAATSAAKNLTALRRTTATLAASPTTVPQGQPTTFTGTVSPSVPGTAVTIQKLSSGSWVGVTVAQVSGGSFTKQYTPTSPGTYRVQVPRSGLNASTFSPPITLSQGPAPDAPVITTASLPEAAKGVAYTATLTRTGGAGTWSRAAGTLPTGLTLNPTTGVISGTPTAAATFSFTIAFKETATNLTGTKALSIVVTPPPTITTATTLPDATRGTAYGFTLTKTGGPGTWDVLNLPAGLTFNATTGEISGVPSQLGTRGVYAYFTETATERVAFKALSLTVGGVPLAITTPTLPDGTKGSPYTVTLTRTGGDGVWSTPELPAGLTLNPTTGVISGTPTVSGLFSVYVGFTENSTGSIAAKGFALQIAPSPVITTTSVPDGTTNTAYSQQLAKTGNDGTWTVTGGILPAGVTVSAAGLLAGTPTESGDFGFTVTFTETGTGYTDTQQLLLHVSLPGAPVITTASLPTGTVGTAYSGQLSATGAAGTWSVSYGALPTGLTLNPTTGAITGTPATGTAGDWLFQVKYTTLTSNQTKVLVIRVNPAPTP